MILSLITVGPDKYFIFNIKFQAGLTATFISDLYFYSGSAVELNLPKPIFENKEEEWHFLSFYPYHERAGFKTCEMYSILDIDQFELFITETEEQKRILDSFLNKTINSFYKETKPKELPEVEQDRLPVILSTMIVCYLFS